MQLTGKTEKKKKKKTFNDKQEHTWYKSQFSIYIYTHVYYTSSNSIRFHSYSSPPPVNPIQIGKKNTQKTTLKTLNIHMTF